MGQYRLVRLGEQLKSEISNMIIRHEIKDPRVNEFLTIHRVDVAGDLAYANVYVSSFMDENSVKRGVQGLQSAAGFIQSSIAKKLIADSSIKDGYEMVQKLNALEKEGAALAPESPAENSAQSSDEEE